jgi:hypothetical protein
MRGSDTRSDGVTWTGHILPQSSQERYTTKSVRYGAVIRAPRQIGHVPGCPSNADTIGSMAASTMPSTGRSGRLTWITRSRLGLPWGENECLRDGVDDQLETADVTTIDHAGTRQRIVFDEGLARRASPRRRGRWHLGAPVYLGSSKETVRLRTVMRVRIACNRNGFAAGIGAKVGRGIDV